MALIEIRKLTKRFGETTILDGVDLDVAAGEVKVVMGRSGSGKSTLMRCINRLVEPTSGSIRVRGVEVTGGGVDIRKLRQSIGFVFQQFALYRHLSVEDNVMLALRHLKGWSRQEAREKARHELSRVEMTAHAAKYPAELSGGQKQRVALARALAMDPDVVFFDEPTSALDPLMVREVAILVNRLFLDGVTVLCVTHDVALARLISDRVVFLSGGRVHAEDAIERLSGAHPDPTVREFFSQDAGLR
jgi:polar amino acid transport system ATP-binding protein